MGCGEVIELAKQSASYIIESMDDEASGKGQEKRRDAERSRKAILSAAEAQFAERGFDAVSLGQVAAAAGLSRGTPSYFFGSKEQLYQAVLEQAFSDREEATRNACRPLVAWASANDTASLRAPMRQAVEGYIEFLLLRPSFLKLIQREELAGGARLRGVPRESRAIEEAFEAVLSAAERRGLKAFSVADAVLVFVSLTFSPLTQRSTFMASLERDLGEPKVRRAHVRLTVDQLLHLTGLN
jgi:TetR/AcrR family transcriptional regulator